MITSNITPSYRRDIVSRVTHDDPESVEALIELMVLTDSQTPIGAAYHLAFIDQLYEGTNDRKQSRDRYLDELKEKLNATQISGSQ